MKRNKRLFGKTAVGAILMFFYLPIIYVVIFSFNSSKSLTHFTGFSVEWYRKMVENSDMMIALYTTIGVALLATAVSTVIGTISAIGISKSGKIVKRLIGQLNDLPIMNPEIVTAIGLMMLFITFRIEKGLITMIIAHITFCIPYVMLSIMPKLKSLDGNLADAAMDLGATPWQALVKVIVPQIKPGIVAGALIAFTMSIDDFVISYFVTGRGIKNLSIMVYTMSKRLNPSINAISTLIVAFIGIMLVIINVVPMVKSKLNKNRDTLNRNRKVAKRIAFGMSAVLILSVFGGKYLFTTEGKYKGKTLHVYNWGEYMAPGIISAFEKKTGAKVVMDNFDSNEQMYIRVANGESYDILVPSDYMIERLKKEGKLRKLNKKKLTAIQDLYSGVKNLPYDRNNDYSVPYFWGSVGIVYNKKKVSEEDIKKQGFSIFQNKKYKGRTYLYDSERDSFMMALKDLGYSMNTRDKREINEAYRWLLKAVENTKPEMVTDEIIDNMAQGRRDIAVMYSGDAAYVMKENKDMEFWLPKSGTNVWSDAMVIPKNAKEVDLAHEFINFVTSRDIAYKNSEYVGYSSPNDSVFDEMRNDKNAYGDISAYTPRVKYPKDEVFAFDEINKKIISNLWSKVKIYASTKR